MTPVEECVTIVVKASKHFFYVAHLYKCIIQFLICYLFFIVPPIIQTVRSKYAAEVGSQITLACNITNTGVPIAQLGWLKNGKRLNNHAMLTNSTFTAKLSNITLEDVDNYTCICIARSARFHRSDSFELRVSENFPREVIPSSENFVCQTVMHSPQNCVYHCKYVFRCVHRLA